MGPSLLAPSFSDGRYVVPSDTALNIRHARFLMNTGSAGVFYVRQNYSGKDLGIDSDRHPGSAKRTIWSTTGGGFALAGQPQNDALEFVSSNAGDTTQSVTIYGTTTGTDTVVSEVLALNGTTQVSSVKTDWGFILGLSLSAACAGTLTAREASGNVSLTTITAGATSKGIYTIPISGVDAVVPVIYADAATTKTIGIIGTDTSDAAADDSNPLDGTTQVAMNASFNTVTSLLVGDLETARTVYLQLGSYVKVGLAQYGSVECGRSWLGVNSTGLGSGVELQAFY